MPSSDKTRNATPLGVIDTRNFIRDDDGQAQRDWLDQLSDALGPVAGPIVVTPLRGAQMQAREVVELVNRCVDRVMRKHDKSAHEPLTEEEERNLGEQVAGEIREELDKHDPYLRLRKMLEKELEHASGDPMRHTMLCRMIDDLDATRLRSKMVVNAG